MTDECHGRASRRELLIGAAAVVAAASLPGAAGAAETQGMAFQNSDTAVVFIDPQNDVLSEKGANWAADGASVTENRTVENMERIFKVAADEGTNSLGISVLHCLNPPSTSHSSRPSNSMLGLRPTTP